MLPLPRHDFVAVEIDRGGVHLFFPTAIDILLDIYPRTTVLDSLQSPL